jgi:hypothetical protein
MFRLLRHMPLLKLFAFAQTALLVRRHLQRLTPADRRRLGELVWRGHRLTRAERSELRRLVARLEPRAFAFATANRFSPVPLPRRLGGRTAR